MNNRKPLVAAFIVAVLLFLVILGGNWSDTFAQTVPTIPTHKPPGKTRTPTPGDLGGEYGEGKCFRGALKTDKELDLFVPRSHHVSADSRWGGVLNPIRSACQDGIEAVCVVPVRYLPKRGTLNYYREGMEVRQYVKGKLEPAESCAPKEVYFDLSGYERYMYDNYNDRFGFYIYNPENKAWEICPDVTFDEEVGAYGRLTCSTTKWGFFTLGWPAKDNK